MNGVLGERSHHGDNCTEVFVSLGLVELWIALAGLVQDDRGWKRIGAPRALWGTSGREVLVISLGGDQVFIDRLHEGRFVPSSVPAVFAKDFQRHVGAVSPPIDD